MCLHVKHTRVLSRSLLHDWHFGSLQYFTQALTMAHVPTRASTHWRMYLPGPAHTGTCTYQGQHTLAHVPTRASTHWHMYLPGPAHTGTCTYQGQHTLGTYQGNYWISSILLQPTTTMVRSSLHSSPHTRTECCTL